MVKTTKKRAPKPALNDEALPTPDSPPADGSNKWAQVASTLALLLAAILVAIFIKAFIVQPYVVDGQSMEPTLHNSDRLLVDKLPRTFASISNHPYLPHRGDIVIFNQSALPGYTGTKQLIKRVIGLPGDRVVVKNGKITVFNSSHPRGFDPDQTGAYHISAAYTPGEVDLTLKTNQIFVCGDNRGNSEDSRYFGPVNADQIVGKLWLRIFPLGKTHSF